METGFKDPIARKNQEPVDKPELSKNSPWDFTCPQYDQRTSCFIKAGTDYKVGHRNPVGHMDGAKDADDILPKGRVNTLKTKRD